MAGMKVKKGDTVQVISGKDRGAKGKVIAAYPEQDRILVEGVNRIRKHTRVTTSQRGSQSGGIITQEASIHVSNVMVVGDDGKPTRVGHRLVVEERGDGRPPKRRSVRISRRTGNDI